jgi:hypothetical protein
VRLIHSVFDEDRIRKLYQESFRVMDRVQLDGRNNPSNPAPDVWEEVSKKWLSNTFNPMSNVYTGDQAVHPEFLTAMDISFHAVRNMGEMTASKAKDKFTHLSSRLNLIKANYEASGNGEGSRLKGESDEQNENDEAPIAIGGCNDRAKFLGGNSPAVLYLWKYAEDIQILPSVLNRLMPEVALDGIGAPELGDVEKKRALRKRKKNGDNEIQTGANRKSDEKFKKEVTTSFSNSHHMFHSHNLVYMEQRIADAETILFDAEEKYFELEADDDAKNAGRLQRMRQRNDHLKRQLNKYQLAYMKYSQDGGKPSTEDDV